MLTIPIHQPREIFESVARCTEFDNDKPRVPKLIMALQSVTNSFRISFVYIITAWNLIYVYKPLLFKCPSNLMFLKRSKVWPLSIRYASLALRNASRDECMSSSVVGRMIIRKEMVCSGSGGRGGSVYWSSVIVEALFKSSFRFTMYCLLQRRQCIM